MSNESKVAIITGAGRGMGAAIARELAARGYQLALMSPSENCERLAAELHVRAVRGSSARKQDLEALVDLAMESYGRIDAAVLHTGHPPKGDLLSITDEQWAQAHELLLMGTINMARLVTPIMEGQGGGAIVNITTYAALEPDLTFSTSCVYRAGIAAFTKLFADRYGAAGIRMNNLLPGFIDSLEHDPAIAQRVPMKRLGSVNEIAKTTAFLLSADAGYITGQNLRVDGGLTRHV